MKKSNLKMKQKKKPNKKKQEENVQKKRGKDWKIYQTRHWKN